MATLSVRFLLKLSLVSRRSGFSHIPHPFRITVEGEIPTCLPADGCWTSLPRPQGAPAQTHGSLCPCRPPASANGSNGAGPRSPFGGRGGGTRCRRSRGATSRVRSPLGSTETARTSPPRGWHHLREVASQPSRCTPRHQARTAPATGPDTLGAATALGLIAHKRELGGRQERLKVCPPKE